MFWTNTAIDILLFFYVIDCVFMGLVIMMQRSKQEGLGAAFGSGMMSDTFGAQTSQVLVKATVWAAIFFFILSISLARLYSVRAAFMEKGSAVQQELLQPGAPVTPPVSPNAPANSPGQPVLPSSTPSTPAPVPPASANPSTPATPPQPASH
jgi:preprotein translocase subunit SecG